MWLRNNSLFRLQKLERSRLELNQSNFKVCRCCSWHKGNSKDFKIYKPCWKLLICAHRNWDLRCLGSWRAETHSVYWKKSSWINWWKTFNLLHFSENFYGHSERKRKLCSRHSSSLRRSWRNFWVWNNMSAKYFENHLNVWFVWPLCSSQKSYNLGSMYQSMMVNKLVLM